jgi:hypothetical protein
VRLNLLNHLKKLDDLKKSILTSKSQISNLRNCLPLSQIPANNQSLFKAVSNLRMKSFSVSFQKHDATGRFPGDQFLFNVQTANEDFSIRLLGKISINGLPSFSSGHEICDCMAYDCSANSKIASFILRDPEISRKSQRPTAPQTIMAKWGRVQTIDRGLICTLADCIHSQQRMSLE